MFTHGNNVIISNLTSTDFDDLGTVNLSTMKTLPFYMLIYKGLPLPSFSESICGGDCSFFADKFFKTSWM